MNTLARGNVETGHLAVLPQPDQQHAHADMQALCTRPLLAKASRATALFLPRPALQPTAMQPSILQLQPPEQPVSMPATTCGVKQRHRAPHSSPGWALHSIPDLSPPFTELV